MKILYVYAGLKWWWDYERRLIDNINATETGITIEFWNWGDEYGMVGSPTLTWSYENRDRLLPFYSELKKRSKCADVVLISPGGGVLPEIMAELSGTVVYCTTDDPDSSEICSFPFLQAADIIAHAGINYDSDRRLSDVFLRRGAKRCLFFPIGFYEEQFPPIDNFRAQFDRRDIDVLYVGHVKRGKLDQIMNHYKGMLVYSRSLKLKHKLYLLAKTRRWVGPFTGNLGKLYKRAKVGINMHFTYGPCNARCYQLNAAGVAQVIDCPEGVAEIYERDKEVLAYGSMKEGKEKIDLLLEDDSLRYEISRAGYERARKQYSRKRTLIDLLKAI